MVLRRVIVIFVLLAAATVPLARAQDPGTETTPTEPPPTVTDTTQVATEPPPVDTAAPATTGVATGLIPDGVSIEGVPVGGLTAQDAAIAVQAAFDQPLQFAYKKRQWWAAPDRLGAKAYVAGAVQRALVAQPGTDIDLVVTVKGAVLDEYIAYLDRNFDRPAKDSTLRLVKLRPKISKAREGYDVDEGAMKASIVRALKSGERGPLPLLGSVVKPKVTEKSFGPIIVIRRGSNRLYLYNNQKFIRRFGVATGQASYPTPLGRWEIVVKQLNPWWYPPDSEWAKDQKPIPPGPGNPLGTRWMGLSAPLVGIHGTPDSYSIGYSASHGCIRMLVPEAEWVFERVEIGTPVFIVRA